MSSNADLILVNGRIHTQNPAQPFVSALAVRDGKIVYTGNDPGAKSWLPNGGSEKLIDLKGACVIPGLTDAHIHFSMYSTGLQRVNAETPTLEEALARVARHAERTPSGGWVTGFGWNHNVWGGNFPSAAQLDPVSSDHPVCLWAKSGHACWVNTRALRLAGINGKTPDPAGGQIVRNATGEPTGILLEEAQNLVGSLIPEPTLDEMVDAIRQGQGEANRAGLTGIHDMDGPLAFQAYQALHQRGELSLRVTKSIPLEHLDDAIGVGLRSGFGDNWLRIGSVKMFADGALGPRTAWMLEGYETAPSDTGIAVIEMNALFQAVRKANSAGLSAAIHAIGDRANREVLDIYAEVAAHEPSGLRNRIEHVQLLHPADAGRLGQLGVIASMQPIHATSDMLIADRHWGKRSQGGYALKTQLKNGAVLALGSDCPVETLDPLVGIHAAVTRRRSDGSPGPEGWYPEQRLSVEEAVCGFTAGPAYAAGDEKRLGSLAPGKLADMTLLNQDIFSIDPMEILNVSVLGTIVGGKFAWRDARV
ncbi:MAG: amidohydrolase [Chloroflexi bacterium]|nr:amidohydrolase [Chloroflexota bacterium]